MVAKPNKKKVNSMLAELGITLKPEDFMPGKAPKEEFKNALPSRKYTKDQEMIQAEATLLSLQKLPKDWHLRNCKGCGEAFYTNYYFVSYCGDQCRAMSLKKMGITWTNHFDEPAKWAGRTPPMIIPPEALKAMRFLVEKADKENPQLAEKQELYSAPPASSSEQNFEHIEHHSQSENEPALLHNTSETPSAPIVPETEDDFLSILNALDV